MNRKRIDKIIDIKENLKKDKEREIEEANVRMANICGEIAKVDADITENHNKLCTTAMSGNDFAVLADYLDYLDTFKSTLICEKESLQENIDVLYQELYEFARELKMLARLREKIVHEFKKSENRREQKLLDEMALRMEEKKF